MLTKIEGDREKNGVPTLERMMEILAALEKSDDPLSIRQLSNGLGVPRSTVYRVLNTLEAHSMVVRDATGTYHLGPRLADFAARVNTTAAFDLLTTAKPILSWLSQITGETSKLSVLRKRRAYVIATVVGSGEYVISSLTGKSFPLHAGAASKVLLAHMPDAEIERLLSEPLESYTSHTITDPTVLRAELRQCRERGWAFDKGEHVLSVCAVAAPVTGPDGSVLAAVSIPFLTDKSDKRQLLRDSVVSAAGDIAAAIPG